MGYLAILKLYAMRALFFTCVKIQHLVRYCFTGRIYPTEAERDFYIKTGKYPSTWYCQNHFLAFAYKHFSEFRCGHLYVKLSGPYYSCGYFVYAHHGTKSETCTYKNIEEIIPYLKYWR